MLKRTTAANIAQNPTNDETERNKYSTSTIN
jgi:hypothetical protein